MIFRANGDRSAYRCFDMARQIYARVWLDDANRWRFGVWHRCRACGGGSVANAQAGVELAAAALDALAESIDRLDAQRIAAVFTRPAPGVWRIDARKQYFIGADLRQVTTFTIETLTGRVCLCRMNFDHTSARSLRMPAPVFAPAIVRF